MFTKAIAKHGTKLKTRSYMDRVQADSHSRTFYIYYMGRFKNKPYYVYGETDDVYAMELGLVSNTPCHRRIILAPTCDNVYAIEKFNEIHR